MRIYIHFFNFFLRLEISFRKFTKIDEVTNFGYSRIFRTNKLTNGFKKATLDIFFRKGYF